MPSEQCFRPQERDGINNGGTKPIQPNESESIEVRQAQPLWCLAPEDIDLLTENQDLHFKSCSRLEQRRHNAPNHNQQFDHETEASTDSLHLASPD